MTVEYFLDSLWTESLAAGDQFWREALDRLAVFDAVGYAYDRQQTHPPGEDLKSVVRMQFMAETRERNLQELPIERVLLFRAIERLAESISENAGGVFADKHDPRSAALPREGVLQYFSEDLRFCLYVRYQFSGAFQVHDVLVHENPLLLGDPLVLLESARDDRDLDIVRTFLASSAKIVLLRNVLVYVDRIANPTVFGPSIDTLLVSDWLITERFAASRTVDEFREFFDEPVSKAATERLLAGGVDILEIGSGSGLILAAFVRKEPMIARLDAVDKQLDAVVTTYRNVIPQRLIHKGELGKRGRYTVGDFDLQSVTEPYDVVVCNPPYIPRPDAAIEIDHRSAATMGTELLEQVAASAAALVGDKGVLFMVTSSLSGETLPKSIPPNYRAEVRLSVRVPFRVESAQLDRSPEALKYFLRPGGGLFTVVSKGRKNYEHDVILTAITKADSNDS
jgi:methylase of polypeptide subunit release factors